MSDKKKGTTELAQMEPVAGLVMTNTEAREFTQAMMGTLQQMANMMAAISENMSAITRRMDLAERLTGGQAQELNRAIRARSWQLLTQYSVRAQKLDAALKAKNGELPFPYNGLDPLLDAGARKVQGLIRRDVRAAQGLESRSLRDLPRCEYPVALNRVAMWDDYDAMTQIADVLDERIGE